MIVANKSAVARVQRGAFAVPATLGRRGRLQVVCFREQDKDIGEKAKDATEGLRSKARDTTEGLRSSLDSKTRDLRSSLSEGARNVVPEDISVTTEQGQSLKEFVQTAGGHPEYDMGEPQENRFLTAYTRRREIFAGRFAMVGFFAACFWEWYFPSHPNILSQIGTVLNLGGLNVSNSTVLTLVAGLVAWNAFSAAAPWSMTWDPSNKRDVAKRPRGPPGDLSDITHPTEFLGISKGWGFSKRNELFNGRMAMLGFLAAILGQLAMGGVYGPGPLAQIANYLNVAPDSVYNNFAFIATAFFIGSTTVSYLLGRPGSLRGEDEIY